MTRIDNRRYYDVFAETYERRRHFGYHAMVDEMETELVRPRAAEAELLEIGCGTGLILQRLSRYCRRAVGVDLSPGMLELARKRGLDVVEGDATALPFGDESFDVVVSFKVLPHVQDLSTALSEAARVTRPGGRLFLEIYNRRSLRYLIRRLRPSERMGRGVREDHVFTRFDEPSEVIAHLPPELRVVAVHGIRVFTVFPVSLAVPGLGWWLRAWERRASQSWLGARYGGFLVLECAKCT